MFEMNEANPGKTAGPVQLIDTKGQVRDLKWLHTVKYGNILLEARNNDSLLFFRSVN